MATIKTEAVFGDGVHAGHTAWWYRFIGWAWCTRCATWVSDIVPEQEYV
jgi:hypothetical protein